MSDDDQFRVALAAARRRSPRVERLAARLEGGLRRPQEAAEPAGGRDTRHAPADGPDGFGAFLRRRLARSRRQVDFQRGDG
jgi:hypothetical protein